MRHLLLSFLATLSMQLHAQVALIDYGFLAVPPSVLVNSIVVQPDGKILVGGAFTNYAGSGKNNLVRLNSDGTVDPTWNPGGSGPTHLVEDIVLMPDGRILIGGGFVGYNGDQVLFVARLHPNGTRDTSFNIPLNAINNAVLAVELHTDGKVLAAGEFFICYGHSMPYIARFNTDGSPDLTFDIGTGFSSRVHDLLVLPDMRILVAGGFNSYNGHACGRIALLAPGGAYDASMNNSPGLGGIMGSARALVRQPDGKILVSGEFSMHHGTSANGIVRIGIDGTRDTGFASPFYPYAKVDAMAVQADGKIIVGGEYTATMYDPNVQGPNRITRLNADGSRDDAFGLGAGALPEAGGTAFVRAIAIQPAENGPGPADRILVGGRFGALDTETQYRQLVRLQEGNTTGLAEQHADNLLNVHFDPATGDLLIHDPFTEAGSTTLQIHTATGQLVHGSMVVAGAGTPIRLRAEFAMGMYLVSVQRGERRMMAKVMVW